MIRFQRPCASTNRRNRRKPPNPSCRNWKPPTTLIHARIRTSRNYTANTVTKEMMVRPLRVAEMFVSISPAPHQRPFATIIISIIISRRHAHRQNRATKAMNHHQNRRRHGTRTNRYVVGHPILRL